MATVTLREALAEERRKLEKLGHMAMARAAAEEAAGIRRAPMVITYKEQWDRIARRPLPTGGQKRKEILKALGQEDIGDMPIEELMKWNPPKPKVNMLEVLRETKAQIAPHKTYREMAEERRKRFMGAPLVLGDGKFNVAKDAACIKIKVDDSKEGVTGRPARNFARPVR